MKKFLLYIFFSCLVVACHRKVALQKTSTIESSIEVHKSVDSSFITTHINSKQYFDFGDTLKGGWLTVDSMTVDSIESAGIKIIATTVKQKTGAVKTNVVAIAKPKQVVNETTQSAQKQKQIATVDSIKKDVATAVKNKDVESSNSTFFMFASLVLLFVIIGIIIYVIGQYKGKW